MWSNDLILIIDQKTINKWMAEEQRLEGDLYLSAILEVRNEMCLGL